MFDTMFDPNMLLDNVRNAIALGHPSLAQLAFATLDDQLTNGGELPNDWRHDDTRCNA